MEKKNNSKIVSALIKDTFRILSELANNLDAPNPILLSTLAEALLQGINISSEENYKNIKAILPKMQKVITKCKEKNITVKQAVISLEGSILAISNFADKEKLRIEKITKAKIKSKILAALKNLLSSIL